jgi:hypothetical protein
MSLENLTLKYIKSVECVFDEMKLAKTSITLNNKLIQKVIEFARAYFEDAIYFKEKKKLEVSLVSIAYCEGLLETLRILGAIEVPSWRPRDSERFQGK